MNVLCNLPLECFEARRRLEPLVSFGPPHRMWVDGVFYPYDVEFDPVNGSVHDLLARLPRGFEPDVLLLWWPDQEPLPARLEESPIPVVGVISDYNLTLPYLRGLWPFFDLILVDRPGVDLFSALGFSDVRRFCQYTFKEPTHYVRPGIPRDVDVGFAGNLNPVVQRSRAPWIERVRALADRGVRVEVLEGVFGDAYGRFLNRVRIGFNRSIRGEMNLRAFEVPACGAMLLMEEENLEVRDFLTPGEECVLYGRHDFEEVVLHYLEDEPARARIAAAGHERVREHTMRRKLADLERMLTRPGPGRPGGDAFARALGRGVAMLTTWAHGPGVLRPLVEAVRRSPGDPRGWNALALALLREGGASSAAAAAEHLQRACACDPRYVPAASNLAFLLAAAGRHDDARRVEAELERRLAAASTLEDLDGPLLPLGYSERAVRAAEEMARSVREGVRATSLQAWRWGLRDDAVKSA